MDYVTEALVISCYNLISFYSLAVVAEFGNVCLRR